MLKPLLLEYLLFVGYLVLFAWLITKIKFFTRAGLSNSQLIILFLIKIMAGIFYGWIGIYYGGLAQMADTWGYHANGILEYRLLLHDPYTYFTNLFQNPYPEGIEKFLISGDSWWSDLKMNVFIKLLSIFDIFSFSNYYVNVIFYSFLTLFGPIAFFRVMTDAFPGRKHIILLATFLVPSFLYWSSGLHKEGLIFTGISLAVYVIYFSTKEGRTNFKRIISLITGLLLVLTLRNFIIVILLPALLTWWVATRWSNRSLAVFTSLYILFGILFFTLRYISPRLDFPQAVVIKQQEFINIKGGNSTIPIKQLKPDAISFLKNTPQAVTLSAVRPYPSDVRHILTLAAATEISVLWLFFILFLFFRTNGARSKSLIWFCIFFSFSLLMAIGFSNNNLGAIVRYRSIIIPFLVVPMLTQIDWKRIMHFFTNNIKNNNNLLKT